MTVNVAAVGQDATLKQVAEAMVDRGVSGIPVVNAERHVLGVVTEADLIAKEASRPESAGILGRFLGAKVDDHTFSGTTAGEIMTCPAVTIEPEDSVPEAARMMIEEDVNRLPVVRDGSSSGSSAGPTWYGRSSAPTRRSRRSCARTSSCGSSGFQRSSTSPSPAGRPRSQELCGRRSTPTWWRPSPGASRESSRSTAPSSPSNPTTVNGSKRVEPSRLSDQAALENWSNDNNVFQAIRLEDLAYDRKNPRVVYIADTGATRVVPNPATGRLHRPRRHRTGRQRSHLQARLRQARSHRRREPDRVRRRRRGRDRRLRAVPGAGQHRHEQEEPHGPEEFSDAKIWQHRFKKKGSWRIVASVNDPGGESSGIVDASKWFGPGRIPGS